MDEKRSGYDKHKIIMDERRDIQISGVIDVLSFDEESVFMETDMGTLMVRGISLHVNKLNLDEGIVSIDGEIEAIEYSEGASFHKGGSFFSKIFK